MPTHHSGEGCRNSWCRIKQYNTSFRIIVTDFVLLSFMCGKIIRSTYYLRPFIISMLIWLKKNQREKLSITTNNILKRSKIVKNKFCNARQRCFIFLVKYYQVLSDLIFGRSWKIENGSSCQITFIYGFDFLLFYLHFRRNPQNITLNRVIRTLTYQT